MINYCWLRQFYAKNANAVECGGLYRNVRNRPRSVWEITCVSTCDEQYGSRWRNAAPDTEFELHNRLARYIPAGFASVYLC